MTSSTSLRVSLQCTDKIFLSGRNPCLHLIHRGPVSIIKYCVKPTGRGVVSASNILKYAIFGYIGNVLEL